MTTATRPLPPAACRLAFERAAVSGHAPQDWQEAVDGVGGQPRARALLELVAALDAMGYPARTAGPGARDQVIVEQVIPLSRSFERVELTGRDISLLAWLITMGEGARFAELLSRVRHW